LSHALVVIASNRKMGMATHPIDARSRLQPVIDKIAQEQTDVVGFLNGLQCRPIGVDVSQQKNAHANLLP
jgi:hypothetical protein